MEHYVKSFVRHPGGAWECITPVEFMGPRGRIQVAPGTRFEPGAVFMGVDVARLLDEVRDGGDGRSAGR